MKTRSFTAERIEIGSKMSFEETTAVFDKEVPPADIAVFTRLIMERASVRKIKEAVERMAGGLGFMALAKVEQGPLVSLLGKPKKIRVYLLGNPVLANRMFERNPGAGLYAPLRVSTYEDASGAVRFAYDRPSTLLGQFQDDEISEVSGILDQRMAELAERVTR